MGDEGSEIRKVKNRLPLSMNPRSKQGAESGWPVDGTGMERKNEAKSKANAVSKIRQQVPSFGNEEERGAHLEQGMVVNSVERR